uniref:Uncharacterized protein n=1 Tax=Romanomermis culicivorax TaxID=13658 RepID=A0A915HQR9_ROMCU
MIESASQHHDMAMLSPDRGLLDPSSSICRLKENRETTADLRHQNRQETSGDKHDDPANNSGATVITSSGKIPRRQIIIPIDVPVYLANLEGQRKRQLYGYNNGMM